MSEQTKVSFTKGKGNTYISEEVDGYLAMLHSAYEEMGEELRELESKSKSEKEHLSTEQERLRGLFEAERQERFKVEMKNKQLEDDYKKHTDKCNEQLAQRDEANHSLESEKERLKTEKEQLKSELVNFKITIEQLEESIRGFPNVDEIKESYENQIEALKRMFISEQEVKVALEGEKRKLQGEINEHLKVIEDLEKKNAEMKNAVAVEAFYEEKVIELEGIIGSIKEGSDAIKKKNEILDGAGERPKADDILEQVQAKRQDMLDKTQEEYRKICDLFERVNKEYVEITSAIPSVAESDQYEELEIEG